MQSANDLSHELMDDDAEENWSVQFAQGDVRTLSLEKLDDAYRLSIIDDETLVWKEGMVRWASLGSVLGVEEVPPAAPPQPRLVAGVGAPLVSAPAQSGVMARVQAPVAVAPKLAVPSLAPQSWQPAAFTIPPPPVAPPRGPFPWFLASVALAVAVFGAFRNDAIGIESSVLGSPSFGTPRAVRALVEKYADAYKTVELPAELLRRPKASSRAAEEESDDSAADSRGRSKVSGPRSRNKGSAGRSERRSESVAGMRDPMQSSNPKRRERASDAYDPLNSKL